MEVTTDMLFSLIGELFVQTRMQQRMLQQHSAEDSNATTQRAIPDYQAWRKEHPDSMEQIDGEGPRSQGTPKGEVM